jgi:DNA-binding HxlR family transcriptional regulator
MCSDSIGIQNALVENGMTDPETQDGISKEILLIRPGKWDLVVLLSLKSGPKRFNTLRSEIGDVSQKVLATALRELERNGLLSRTQYPSIPPRVDYELTDLGLELLANIETLLTFIETNHLAIRTAREEFDRLHGAGPNTRK